MRGWLTSGGAAATAATNPSGRFIGGATALRLTVPVDDAPPTTLIGLSVIDVRVMDEVGVMLSAENRVVVPRVAVS